MLDCWMEGTGERMDGGDELRVILDSGGFVGTYQTDGKALDLKKRDGE